MWQVRAPQPGGRRPVGAFRRGALYNEAAGLAGFMPGSARSPPLRHERRLACEIVYGRWQCDASLDVAQGLPAGPRMSGGVAVAQFRQEAALLAGLDHASRGAVLFMDADGQHPPALINWSDTGSTTGAMSFTRPRRTGKTSRACYASPWGFYSLINWGRARDPRGRRRLPPAVAARSSLAPERNRLQGPRQLDRVPPAARRLRAAAQPMDAQAGACDRSSASRSKA